MNRYTDVKVLRKPNTLSVTFEIPDEMANAAEIAMMDITAFYQAHLRDVATGFIQEKSSYGETTHTYSVATSVYGDLATVDLVPKKIDRISVMDPVTKQPSTFMVRTVNVTFNPMTMGLLKKENENFNHSNPQIRTSFMEFIQGDKKK